MAFESVSHLGLPELSSVRRLREAGVKGMKWGTKHANNIASKLQKAGFKHTGSFEDSDGYSTHKFKHPDGRSANLQSSAEHSHDYGLYDKKRKRIDPL
jgi:hypothetical protein